jgi:hypothetical protein
MAISGGAIYKLKADVTSQQRRSLKGQLDAITTLGTQDTWDALNKAFPKQVKRTGDWDTYCDCCSCPRGASYTITTKLGQVVAFQYC